MIFCISAITPQNVSARRRPARVADAIYEIAAASLQDMPRGRKGCKPKKASCICGCLRSISDCSNHFLLLVKGQFGGPAEPLNRLRRRRSRIGTLASALRRGEQPLEVNNESIFCLTFT